MMLAEAGQLQEQQKEERDALRELVMSRTVDGRQHRRRRVLLPALGLGGVLTVLLGAGAVVATQWGPWNYVQDEDIVIAREWVDVDGTSLGSCESRLAADELPADALNDARDYLAALDTESLDPDPEVVASLLVAVNRPDRMGQLIPGTQVSDYDVTHTGPVWSQGWWSDARILQDGLVSTVFAGMANDLTAKWPELDSADSPIASKIQTQCTTDPAGLWDE